MLRLRVGEGTSAKEGKIGRRRFRLKDLEDRLIPALTAQIAQGTAISAGLWEQN